MNNAFGIPDDLLIAMVNAAIQQKGQQTKSHTPENPFKIDPAAMAKKSASTTKQLYDAYVEVGFTAEQAFELGKGILTAKKN